TASADDINEETPVEETAGDIHAEKAKEYEISGVERAERGDLDGAMECFSMAIEAASNRASGYNNRAQLWRLKGDIHNAMNDLDKAIELEQHGAAAAQAYTQRGLIHKLQGNDDDAYHDFQMGAQLGNKFAKSMAIQSNPYAAMCNKMLAEAIGKLSEYNPE
ncbi:hypothetical protein QZH41_002067, partial [Actinostola sp. cb2023]